MSQHPSRKALAEKGSDTPADYDLVLTEVVWLLEDSRRASARAVNAVMTATYWDVGRRIAEGEQSGGKRAGYGRELLKRLSFASWRSRVSSPAGFYEAEALRGGWSVRQLDRRIISQFYERTALSRNKAAVLRKGSDARPEDVVYPEDEIKDPFVLEFLGLRDEYSES